MARRYIVAASIVLLLVLNSSSIAQDAAPLNVLDRPLLMLRYKASADRTAFSPDGRILASYGDHMIRLTDLQTGEAIAATRLTHHAWGMTFAPDGKSLLLASNVGTIEVLRLPTLVQDHTLRVAERYNVYALAVSADSKRAAAADGDGVIQIFDIASEKSLITVGSKGERNAALAFSPDGARLAAVDDAGMCVIYDTQTGAILKSGRAGKAVEMRFDRAGKTLALAGHGTQIYFWNTLDDAAPNVMRLPDVLIGKMRVNGLVIGIPDDGVDFRPMNAPLGDFASGVTALSRDFATAASFLENGNVALWDVPNRKLLQILRVGNDVISGGYYDTIRLSDDRLAVTGRSGPIQVWRIRGNAEPPAIAQPIDVSVLPGPWGEELDGIRTRLILEPVKPDAPNRQEGPPIPGHPHAISQGVWWRVLLQVQNQSDKARVFVYSEFRQAGVLSITRDGQPVKFLPIEDQQLVTNPYPISVGPHDITTSGSMLLGRMHDMSTPGKYRIAFPKTESPQPLPGNVTNAILPASNVLEFTVEK